MYLFITPCFDEYHVYGQIDENTLEGPYDLNHEVLYKLLSFMKPVQMRSMFMEKMYEGKDIRAFYLKSIIYYYFFRYECIASISNELFTSI